MVKYISTVLLAVLFTASPLFSQKGIMGYKQLPKQARQYFEDMAFVPMGSYMQVDASDEYYADEYEHNLILVRTPMRISLDAFFISEHEVTNAEYRAFTTWVRKQAQSESTDGQAPPNSLLEFSCFIAREAMDVLVYPDTTCWTQEFPLSFNEPMSKLYFWHPAYDDYPVVGVSYEQAMAYCVWKSERLNEELMDANMEYPEFRLPSETEWEWAAMGGVDPVDLSKEARQYPWKAEPSECEDGFYQANFGSISDRNGILIKGAVEDGYMLTSKVKSFRANDLGLYDMFGNVAEWVGGGSDAEQYAKGGSWHHGPIYLEPSVKTVHPRKEQSSLIGFRVAMSYEVVE